MTATLIVLAIVALVAIAAGIDAYTWRRKHR